ncbi:MAG: zf-HC2 domain-containing protein, partial [Acidobacteriota bacterium]
MNCENYLKLIDDLIEGELDEPTADKVSLHILDCTNCTSQFELLEREKEVYSHYLFDIEPPKDLLASFQIKLETQENQTIVATQSFFSFSEWTAKMFGFLRFNPILVASVVLIIFAVVISFLNFGSSKQGVEKARFAPIKEVVPGNSKTIQNPTPEANKKDEIAQNKEAENRRNKVNNFVSEPVAIRQTVTPKKVKDSLIPKNKNDFEIKQTPLQNEEQAQFLEIRNLETETAKQIEKVELLLRSFRNARLIEGTEIYDVGYEKQQARKLLQNNVILRQKAEIYGT